MIKYIKKFYNLLKILKRYHAVHAIVILPDIFFAFYLFFVFLTILNGGANNELTGALLFSGFLYILVLSYSLYITIFIAILNCILQCIKGKKIYVSSKFLLNNKFYNVIYTITLLHYITMIVLVIISRELFCTYVLVIFLGPIFGSELTL